MSQVPSSSQKPPIVSFPVTSTQSPLCKPYVFALALIAGIAFLGMGVAGSYVQQTALNAGRFMVKAGIGLGIGLLVVGMIGLIKSRPTEKKNPPLPTTSGVLSFSPANTPEAEFIAKAGKGAIRGLTSFGKECWEKYCDSFFDKEIVEPELPSNIHDILNSPCPFAGKATVKVKDTHMLVLIPAGLTLSHLYSHVAPPQGLSVIMEEDRRQSVSASYWVLMTKDLIPGSIPATRSEQALLLERATSHITRRGNGYEFPTAIEAATCALMEHLYSQHKMFPQGKATRCSEPYYNYTKYIYGYSAPVHFEKWSRVVGNFNTLLEATIEPDEYSPGVGLAPLRRFRVD